MASEDVKDGLVVFGDPFKLLLKESNVVEVEDILLKSPDLTLLFFIILKVDDE